MPANQAENRTNWPGSEVAHNKIAELESFLCRMSDVLSEEFAGVPSLTKCGEGPIACNAYDIEYVFRSSARQALYLGFILAGRDSILFQAHDESVECDLRRSPAKLEQRVYRLNEINELRRDLEEKIASHLLS